MTLVYIGVFMMSIAFAIVSIFLAKLLLKTSSVVGALGQTVDQVEKKLDQSIIELESVITETKMTATDVQDKLQATSGLFLAMEDLGQSTENVSSVIEKKTEQYNKDGLTTGTNPFVRAIQMGEFGFGLLKSWNKGKKVSS